MANFTQNISNSVRVFSEGPSTKWGQASSFTTMVWGTSTWGEGESLPLRVIKVVSNSLDTSGVFAGASVVKAVSIGSASVAFEMSSERLSQNGWTYVFPSLATDGEERDFATWSAVSATDATFTCGTAGSTSWSEA